MKMINRLSLLLILLVFTSNCAAKTIYVYKDPPAMRVEIKSKKPASNYIWIQGNWQWSRIKGEYIWKKGYWKKKKNSKIWIAGRWKKTPRGWTWKQGYWK